MSFIIKLEFINFIGTQFSRVHYQDPDYMFSLWYTYVPTWTAVACSVGVIVCTECIDHYGTVGRY